MVVRVIEVEAFVVVVLVVVDDKRVVVRVVEVEVVLVLLVIFSLMALRKGYSCIAVSNIRMRDGTARLLEVYTFENVRSRLTCLN